MGDYQFGAGAGQRCLLISYSEENFEFGCRIYKIEQNYIISINSVTKENTMIWFTIVNEVYGYPLI